MMQIVDQYSSAVPIHLRPMLSGVLRGLGDKMTDETIYQFIEQTRKLLDFVEVGGSVPFADVQDGEGAFEHVGDTE
jgi:hypothetical protein